MCQNCCDVEPRPECGCVRQPACSCGCGRTAGLDDPERQGGIPPIEDPERQGGIPPIEDPERQGGIPPIEDPQRPTREALCGGRGGGFAGSGKGAWVIVRLAPELPAPSADSLQELASQLNLDGLLAVLEKYELASTRRVVYGPQAKHLEELERCAARGPLPPLRSLTSYWGVDVRQHMAQADEIVERLGELHEVDHAYRQLAATDPGVGGDPFSGMQGYLDAAPLGIDARWAWTHTDGSGVGVADLEQGWVRSHEDLGNPQLVYGDDRHGVGAYTGNHGAAVLGEMVARASDVGVVGIAPGVKSVQLFSHWQDATGTNGWVAEAIVEAIGHLSAGDVLLLEVQRGFLPTEIDDADFDAIRLAVSHGIVVVEAAGNAGANLDRWRDAGSGTILNRCSCDFRDSGAIVVGCGLSALPHNRKAASNYGSRLDCYAWGDGVASCGYGDLQSGEGDHQSYTATFSNTSAASPIIAGAALLVQSRYQTVTAGRLSPLQMRGILGERSTGTAQGPDVAGCIGVMPDLRAIFHRLGLVPRAYLRAHERDFGGPFASPDLVLETADGGDEQVVRLSLCNAGRGVAESMTASVYASPVATLPVPDLWQKLGTMKPVDVPQGGTPCPAEPLHCAIDCAIDGSGMSAGVGGVCLVAQLHSPNDLAAETRDSAQDGPQRIATWRDYLTALSSGRLAFRNVHSVDSLEPAGKRGEGAVELPFLVTGPPSGPSGPRDGGDRPRRFDFEIVQRLPEGVHVTLELPAVLKSQLPRMSPCCEESNLMVPSLPRVVYRAIRLAAGARHHAVLRVYGRGCAPSEIVGEVAIRQIWAGREVGCVIWRF